LETIIIKLRWVILIIVVFLCAYAGVCIQNNGDTLKVIKGVVEKCDQLGGAKTSDIAHATIKTELGGYIISSLKECSPRSKVNVHLNRGILYFNTVYSAEKV
jgi:hypothetical protein